MENNPAEPTVAPVKDDCVKDDCVKENPVHEESAPSSLDRVKGWWGDYHQFVAGAVFGVSAILLGSFLRSRRN
jgi:hypothetical protein